MTSDQSPAQPDPEADTRWVLALYGATMLAIQGLKNTISWLFLLTDISKNGLTNGSARRQWAEGVPEVMERLPAGTLVGVAVERCGARDQGRTRPRAL